MEIVVKVFTGIVGLIMFCLIAGFIDISSENRKRRKDLEERERFLREHNEEERKRDKNKGG